MRSIAPARAPRSAPPGKIIGNVEIDNQASVTVTGGSGKPFGKWTGGTITIGNGDLTFVRNTALRDDISVDGGKGTVTNMGRLRVAAPETIAGNFTQAPAGVLVLNFAGDVFGEYGALTVSKLTTLDGRLTIRLADSFTLATHDSFDILTFGSLTGNFDALTLDGVRYSSPRADIWTCGGGVRLRRSSTPRRLICSCRVGRPSPDRRVLRPSQNPRPGRCGRWASSASAASASANARGRTKSGYDSAFLNPRSPRTASPSGSTAGQGKSKRTTVKRTLEV